MMRIAPFTARFQCLLLAIGLGLVSMESAGCAGREAKQAEAPAASDQPAQGTRVARDISDVELEGLVASRPDLVLLDVRTDKEWEDGHIGGASFLDFLEDDFLERARTLPRDRPIALYCAAGGRSEDAMNLLAKEGFRELYNLRGGFYGWEDAGRPVSHEAPAPLPAE